MANFSSISRPAYAWDAVNNQWVPIGIGPHTHSSTDIVTPLTTKGDLYSYGTTPTRFAAGPNGSVLVPDSTTTSGLNWTNSYGFSGGKNTVMNGGFDFWTRGTSFSNPASIYTADRFKVTVNAPTGNYTASQQPAGLNGFRYCLRIQRNAGDTGGQGGFFLGHSWAPEDTIPLQGQTVSYSFYARAGANFSASNSAIGVYLFYGTGNGQQSFASLTNEGTIVSSAFYLTTAWQRFYVTTTIPANATELRMNTSFGPQGTAGTNDYYEITGIQLESGSTPTQFSRYGGSGAAEALACKYYCEKLGGNAYTSYGSGINGTSTTARMHVPFSTKRVPPTASFGPTANFNIWGSSNFNGIALTGISQVTSANDAIIVGATVSSGLTAGYSNILIDDGSNNSYIIVSADF